ncbi:peptidoglycan-binding protein [Streptomyces sp. NBC_00059]|uniref:peptidoglycan-binding domain-containing protein n=1 Tax=Streptomyces sp. NBC_00059 TaxID=2975635 RepID=UPI00224E606F|nr:peptidoglycan-binding domain-containing protein [Streptomyces sp. NBC_00059]MCX5417763.1 peptidoglycan-binding protein [Streptomyces sp. NBC_00059]
MNFRTKQARMVSAAIGALAATVLAVSVTPASAAASDGYIRGAGSIYDDFGDEGTLSTTSYSSSSATCFWQSVLYAEGAMKNSESRFAKSDIDGEFGSKTKFATRNLQHRWGLTVDGIVGKNTMSKLDAKRVYNPDLDGGTWIGHLKYLRTTDNGNIVATYYGKYHSFGMVRAGSSGRWHFTDVSHSQLPSIAADYGRNSC